MEDNDELERLLKKPTISPAELQRVLGGSRNGTYDAIKRGDIESFNIGKKIHIPTTPLRRKLGMA